MQTLISERASISVLYARARGFDIGASPCRF